MTTIAELNDSFRTTLRGGRALLSRGVDALPHDVLLRIVDRVKGFNEFNQDNDPHGEHDMGMFEESGHSIMWKIDYYDKAMEFGSDDPADPERTTRVLTILLASDY